MRWNRVNIDLTELAKLRWIKKKTIPEICQDIGMARSAVQVSIRTIRNSGISNLKLTNSEQKIVQEAINEEIALLDRTQPKFRLSNVSLEFQKGDFK